tara:strand:- start:203 stop:355 length:153 start_codon:yes stop_codon:yes gene_type:complete
MRHTTNSLHAHRAILEQALDYDFVPVTLSGVFEHQNYFGTEQLINLEMAS